MKMNRVFSMPDRWTFRMKPVAELLQRYVKDGRGWVDPFAGDHSPAELTNDINPKCDALYHFESEEFARRIEGEIKGILFDPPYSLEQLKRSYENIGRRFTQRDGQICGRWVELKDILSSKLISGGLSVSFGWNSAGFGKSRGFIIEEILLIYHGAGHNDTIVIIERKR